MIEDLAGGEIDGGILWGPMAGYYAKQAIRLCVRALCTRKPAAPPIAFRIAMGVRPADQEWKRPLNRLIAGNQAEINRLLNGYGVPMLDDQDRPITSDAPAR